MKKILYLGVVLLLTSCRMDGYSYYISSEVNGNWVSKSVYIHYGYSLRISTYIAHNSKGGTIDKAKAIDSFLNHWADSTILVLKKNGIK